MDLPITIDRGALAAFCRRHHISRLAIFGSALRDDFGQNSDIDMLVEFEPGHVPGWEFFNLEDELTRIVGHEVDLNTPGFLSRSFRSEVVAHAQTLYEK